MARTHAQGSALLEDPLTNKGTAFSDAERRKLGLDGLLPPAVGLGVIASGATRVTDTMMQAAATALGAASPALTDPHGSLLPPVGQLREVALKIAGAVANAAVADGVAPQASEAEIQARVAAAQ